jgi:ankyrin repeat protein
MLPQMGFKVVGAQLLEDNTAEVNLPDQWGRTPLSWAAGNGHKAVVKQSLDNG